MAVVLQPPFWVPRPGDPTESLLSSIKRNTPLFSILVTPTPTKSRQPSFYSEDTVWNAAPNDSAIIQILGHKPFTNRRTVWYSEDSTWNAEPINSAIIQILGFKPFKTNWNYNYDDPVTLGPATERNLVLLATLVVQVPTTSRQASFNYDDSSAWLQTYTRNPNLYKPVVIAPFSNKQVYFYSEDSGWQGQSTKAYTLGILTTKQVPTKTWHYDYDVAESSWLQPVSRNLNTTLFVAGTPLTKSNVLLVLPDTNGDDYSWQQTIALNLVLQVTPPPPPPVGPIGGGIYPKEYQKALKDLYRHMAAVNLGRMGGINSGVSRRGR